MSSTFNMPCQRSLLAIAAVILLACISLQAQIPDPGKDLNKFLAGRSDDRFRLSFEFRVRPEARTGDLFGLSPNLENPLIRLRVGAQFDVKDWLRISAMGQDARAPEYGRPAPGSARDTMDLQEGYIELFARRQEGLGAVLGRQMINLGEGRLIGNPQWVNTSRTFDTLRLYYRLPKIRLEALMVSVVKIRPDEFNRPNLGDRVWGTYSSFSNIVPQGVVDVYLLRHEQNRPGGFSGVGRLGTNTVGARAAGSFSRSWKYGVEAAVQNGKTGPVAHRGYAWFSSLSRTLPLRFPLDLEIEYKYASGSRNSALRDGTFDQLYPANHDKFGHADLFGWRNLRNLRSLDTLHISKSVAFNFMYDNWWLASATDALYNPAGVAIARSPNGTAGTHVGQETDFFTTYHTGGWTFGAGFAHTFLAEFLRKTTPGVNTRYLYVFQSYSF